MYRYELIFYWSDKDERFVVEMPELQGCMADGRTYTEAEESLDEALFLMNLTCASSVPTKNTRLRFIILLDWSELPALNRMQTIPMR